MKITLKKVEYKRTAFHYLSKTRYFWMQVKKFLLTVKL